MAKVITYGHDEDDAEAVPGGVTNEIISITEAKTYAVNWVDKTGHKATLLALVFGQMPDGGAGVFVMAEAKELQEKLKVPSAEFLGQFRALLGKQGPVGADQLPPSTLDDADD